MVGIGDAAAIEKGLLDRFDDEMEVVGTVLRDGLEAQMREHAHDLQRRQTLRRRRRREKGQAAIVEPQGRLDAGASGGEVTRG